jgi:hypothetical protein
MQDPKALDILNEIEEQVEYLVPHFQCSIGDLDMIEEQLLHEVVSLHIRLQYDTEISEEQLAEQCKVYQDLIAECFMRARTTAETKEIPPDANMDRWVGIESFIELTPANFNALYAEIEALTISELGTSESMVEKMDRSARSELRPRIMEIMQETARNHPVTPPTFLTEASIRDYGIKTTAASQYLRRELAKLQWPLAMEFAVRTERFNELMTQGLLKLLHPATTERTENGNQPI